MAIQMTESIQIQAQQSNAACSDHFNILRLVCICLMMFFLYQAKAAAMEADKCQPFLKTAVDVSKLPCGGTIKATNDPGSLNSERALAQARDLLWHHFSDSSPFFLNVELVSKEGLRTRIVAFVSHSEGGSVLTGWDESREQEGEPGHSEKWAPVSEMIGTKLSRDPTTQTLTLRNDGKILGSL